MWVCGGRKEAGKAVGLEVEIKVYSEVDCRIRSSPAAYSLMSGGVPWRHLPRVTKREPGGGKQPINISYVLGSAGTFNMTTSYQEWVWEREANINWSMVICQGNARSELP